MKTKNLVLSGRIPARNLTPVATLKVWLNKHNQTFSVLFDERVTNKEVIITSNLAFSFVPLLAFSFEQILPALVAVAYFAFSASLTFKKGGKR